MFNLSRYFSTLSLVLVLLAAGGLGLLYRELSLRQMSELAESRNVAMARIFENALHESLEQLMTASVGRDADFLRQSADVGELRQSAVGLMHDQDQDLQPPGHDRIFDGYPADRREPPRQRRFPFGHGRRRAQRPDAPQQY